MVLFAPIAYPFSHILDLIVGVESREFYDRNKLRVLISMQKDIRKAKGESVPSSGYLLVLHDAAASANLYAFLRLTCVAKLHHTRMCYARPKLI